MSDQAQLTAYAKVDAVQGWPNRHPGLPVLVRIVAPLVMGDRALIDLVVVLDVSCGHLAPVKGQDLIEDAMKFIIEKLTDKDRLAIVPIQTSPVEKTVLREMSVQGRNETFEKVKSLAVSSDKKVSMALVEAGKILNERQADQKGRIGFIILISDGNDASIFTENININYSVHAFGFRDAHNVEAMHHIAEQFKGTYAILNDEHDRITEAFEASINKITTVVAVLTEIDITCSHPMVALSDIEAGRFRSGVRDDKKTGFINAGALNAGAVRNFIIYVDNLRDNEYNDLPKSLSVHTKYLDASSWAKRELDGQVLAVREGIDDRSKEVAAEIVRLEAVNIVHDIVSKYKNDKALVQAVDELRQRWIQLKDSDYGREAGAACLISGLASEMEEMEASMRRCSGQSYMRSWHTCHTLQHQTRRRRCTVVLSSAKGKRSIEAPPPPPQMPLMKDTFLAAHASAGADYCGGYRKHNYEQHHNELGMIEQRLAYWNKVKCELPSMLHDGAGECPDQTMMVFREAYRESIKRTMFQDVYLAVVYATDRRSSMSAKCSCSTGTENLR